MNGNIRISYELPHKKLFGDYSFLLPRGSKLESDFCRPLAISFKNINQKPEEDTLGNKGVERVYIHSGRIEDITPVINQMSAVLPDFCNKVLQKLTESNGSQLLYISNAGDASEFMASVLCQLDFEILDGYYVSEVQKIAGNSFGTHSRLCLLDAYSQDFSFIKECTPGSIIIGGVLLKKIDSREVLKKIMRVDFLCKEALNEMIGDKAVSAVWMCSKDLDSLAIWHKEIEGKSILPIAAKVFTQ